MVLCFQVILIKIGLTFDANLVGAGSAFTNNLVGVEIASKNSPQLNELVGVGTAFADNLVGIGTNLDTLKLLNRYTDFPFTKIQGIKNLTSRSM